MRRLPLAILTLILTACASGPDEQPPRPQPARHAAAGTPPTRIVPALLSVVDTDANRRADTIVVVTYLFDTAASPVPFHADGQMVFTLTSADAQPLATWTFPKEEVATHRDADAIGPRHTFTLDLRAAAGTDLLPAQKASLTASFTRTDGVTIRSVDPVAVPIGG